MLPMKSLKWGVDRCEMIILAVCIFTDDTLLQLLPISWHTASAAPLARPTKRNERRNRTKNRPCQHHTPEITIVPPWKPTRRVV